MYEEIQCLMARGWGRRTQARARQILQAGDRSCKTQLFLFVYMVESLVLGMIHQVGLSPIELTMKRDADNTQTGIEGTLRLHEILLATTLSY